MQASDAIRAVRRELKSARQDHGQLWVEIKALDIYLATVEAHADQVENAVALNVQVQIAGAQLDHAARMDFAREVNDSAKSALNTVILVNGGAAVAMLGYLGSTTNLRGANGAVRDAMAYFGVGVLLGTFGFATRYFSGSAMYHGNTVRSGRLSWVTIFAGLAAIGCFGLGVAQAYQGF